MAQETVFKVLSAVLMLQSSLGCASLLRERHQPVSPIMDLRRYFPLIEGGEWVYDIYRVGGGRVNSYTVRHTEVRRVDENTVTAKVVTVDEVQPRMPIPHRRQVTYRYLKNEVEMTSLNLFLPNQPETAPWTMLKGPLVPGNTWTNQSYERGREPTLYQVEGFETIETKQGRYDFALKVKQKWSWYPLNARFSQWGHQESWLAPDIGAVRSLSAITTKGAETTTERTETILRSFRVNPLNAASSPDARTSLKSKQSLLKPTSDIVLADEKGSN
ncbi:hypothetical protein D3C72_468130 [compost metagenome]